jgi:hypothetical protein
MITRRWGFPRLFGAHPYYRDDLSGLLTIKVVNDIPHMWPVARPGGVYTPNAGHNNLHVHELNRGLENRLVRSQTPTLQMGKPNLAMDPSDSRTWQRPYLFT